jgi:NADH-quinone oxidoreductase subunit M
MYFMIGVWGGGRKIYAAVKFVLFTMFGSLLMLLAIIKLYIMTSPDPAFRTTDLMTVMNMPITPDLQVWLFLAFALAFAIKVPLFPFHTWLPDAHVEAPTAGSVILAGVLLKMGTYGFLRFCLPLFPDATLQFVPLISILSLIGIIYGALIAMVQKDVKSLVAYSSVAHLGFVMLGMFALTTQGLTGSILQMVNHGLSACHAAIRHRIHDRNPGFDRSARHQRFCGGIPYPVGDFQGQSRICRYWNGRNRPGGSLYVVDGAKSIFRYLR